MVPYPGYHNMRPDISRFSLDDQSCVGLEIDNSWPFPENQLWLKASVSNAEEVELKFISSLFYLLCEKNFSIY